MSNEPAFLQKIKKIIPQNTSDRCSEVKRKSTGNTDSQPVDIKYNIEKKNTNPNSWNRTVWIRRRKGKGRSTSVLGISTIHFIFILFVDGFVVLYQSSRNHTLCIRSIENTLSTLRRSILCVWVLWCCCRRCGDSLIDVKIIHTRQASNTLSIDSQPICEWAITHLLLFISSIVYTCVSVCVCRTELVAANTHACQSQLIHWIFCAFCRRQNFVKLKCVVRWNW